MTADDPEGPAHCPSCHNRLRRIIRCSICADDTRGEYLRSKWREGNVLSVLVFCKQCVDSARQEISLELSQDDSAAIIRHLTRKHFDRLMTIADQLAEAKGLEASRSLANSAPCGFCVLPGSA